MLSLGRNLSDTHTLGKLQEGVSIDVSAQAHFVWLSTRAVSTSVPSPQIYVDTLCRIFQENLWKVMGLKLRPT